MLPSRTVLIVLIVAIGFGAGMRQRQKLAAAQGTLLEAQAQQATLDKRNATVKTEVETLRRDIKLQAESRAQKSAELKKAHREISQSHPELRWVSPPPELPHWEADSPYIWLRKETLPALPFRVFSEAGTLTDDFASMLTLTKTERKTLQETLPKVLRKYHELEAQYAEKIDEHLPGISGDGEKVTIRVKPSQEIGHQVKQEFESALREIVGVSRAELVMQVGQSWLDEQFALTESAPKTISVIRRQRGGYTIAVRAGSNWLSMGVPKGREQMLRQHIPVHLRPMFAEFLAAKPQ